MKLELQVAAVLEPLHAVPRAAVGRSVIERVTVAVEDIGISVPIEVDDRDPARAKIRVRGPPDEPGSKLPLPVVDEGPDLLPLLADECHDVGIPVAVEVG